MSIMRVGVSSVNFTPSLGLPLMGHFRDDYAAKAVHDPLCARALVVANDTGHKVAPLTLDLCMVNRWQVRMMREHVAAHSSIPPDNILVAATHTHGGYEVTPGTTLYSPGCAEKLVESAGQQLETLFRP